MEYKISILVVEDTKSWRDIFAELLTSRGYLVETVSSYIEAKQILRRKSFDMAVVDIRLSEDKSNIDGMKVLADIRNAKDPTNIVIVSGFATVELARNALVEFKALDILEKDRYDEDKFIEVVERGTQGARAFGYGSMSFSKTFFVERGLPVEETSMFPGSIQEIEELLHSLFVDLWPFAVFPQSTSKLLNVWHGEHIAQIVGWSKRKGEAVAVRIGPRNMITKESRNYNDYKLEKISNSLREEPHYKSDLGGLVYILKDAPPDSLRDFTSFYLEENVSNINQATQNLFWRSCNKLYLEKGIDKVRVNLSSVYKPVIQQIVDYQKQEMREEERYLRQLEENELQSYLETRDQENRRGVNPFEFVRRQDFIFDNCPVCVVHGDLRDGNIIFDSSGAQAWLVGFYDTELTDVMLAEDDGADSVALRAYQVGKRNMLHDFATLEVSIRETLGNVDSGEVAAFDLTLCEPKTLVTFLLLMLFSPLQNWTKLTR